MNFELTEDQVMLQDSLTRLLRDRYGFDARNKYLKSPEGRSPAAWSAFAGLGLLGLAIPEDHGGVGGDGVDIMIAMRAFGAALSVEPFLASVVLSAGVISAAGSAPQRAALLPAMIAGEAVYAFAHAERHSRYDLAYVETTARLENGCWHLDGEKIFVRHGDAAARIIVSARIAGSSRDKSGLALFLIDPAAPGVSRKAMRTQDRYPAANITFDGVKLAPGAVLGTAGEAYAVIERVADQAMAALCAEAVGCMEAAYGLTLEYLKTRQQFGVAIGSFQVLQHRAADMLVMLELARSMMLHASFMANDPDPAARHRAVAAAKVQVGKAGRFIGQQAIQLHGGIGTTEAYAVGHYLRRLIAIDTEFGDPEYHISQLAASF
jgi:alkylation response protein AidB-like acyl-CoA dehydrogenase